MLILKEILDPKYGMFKYYQESRNIWFNGRVSICDPTRENMRLMSYTDQNEISLVMYIT